MLNRRVLLPVGTAAALAASPGLAMAAWAKAGTGSGAAQGASITPPTGVTVPSSTVTNGTVAVSWTASSAPSGASVTYLVERNPGSGYVAACGTGATPTAAVSCSDTSVANGIYTYRVTAKVGANWQAISSASGSVTVTAGVQAPTGLSATIQGGSKFTPSWTAPSAGTPPTGYECQLRSPQGTAVNTAAAGGGSGSVNTWFSCTNGVQVNTTSGSYTLYVRGVAGTGGATKGTPSSGVNIAP